MSIKLGEPESDLRPFVSGAPGDFFWSLHVAERKERRFE
jgi:hypothetical protein